MPLTSPQFVASCAHAQAELARLVSLADTPFLRSPPQGYMRGIDFYRASDLVKVMGVAISEYAATHGAFPDLVHPKGFNAWIIRRKFLEPMRIPESGNKLLTHRFLPPTVSGVRCAEILWHAPHPKLPPNDAVRPGTYFLKANHGSGMNECVTYPITDERRVELEGKSLLWLKRPYGRASGEWWYSIFKHEILIEEHLGDDRLSFNFFCFRGHVALVVMHDKKTSETITMRPDFTVIHHKHPHRVISAICSKETLHRMADAASGIGQPLDFVRVDFFLTDQGEIIVGEMTFTPGNGRSKRPAGIDAYLGRAWRNAVDA